METKLENMDDEMFDIFCEIINEKMKDEYTIVEQNKDNGKWDGIHSHFQNQLQKFWRDEFVDMYKAGHIIKILIEWENWENKEKNNIM